MITKTISIIFSFIISINFAHANSQNILLKKQGMQNDIRFLAHLFDMGYAPSVWKGKHLGWTLDEQLKIALDKRIHLLKSINP